MKSGEFLQKTNITRDTLRHYNRLGFLHPHINIKNGYGDYSKDDVWMVEFIKSAQSIGFSLRDISELAKQMKSAECKHRSLLPFLRGRLKDVDEKILSLKKIGRHLRFLIEDFEKKDCRKSPSKLVL